MELDDSVKSYSNETLETWVIDKAEEWREHYDDNYKEKFDEYYRLWRGIWAKEDALRDSERSKLIAPALQQAVESSVAEVEEATFGRGKWFDIKDDFQDGNQTAADVEFTKKQLFEDMQYAKARSSISEVLINSAVFGTGIGEVYLEEIKEFTPGTRENTETGITEVGVTEKERFLVKLRPVMPQNFLIDPLATDVESALGCAVDQYVSMHQIIEDQERGVYRDIPVGTVESDPELEPDQELTYENSDRVRLTRYYGLVPRELFGDAYNKEDVDELTQQLYEEEIKESDGSYVEAIVVVANEETLLKVEPNPYMMSDRPIVAFQWDTVPSRFWGRGVCEKGYNAQKALDTEMRARIDGLALTMHPMMGIDASRMPRGAKFNVRPGKSILTNGNPSEILQPLNFGGIDQVTFAQGQQLQDMIQQATGAVDSAGMQGMIGGDAKVGAVSMSLGAIIKRHKRTLLNFQDNFLIPFVQKAAYRYMQFNPELYRAQDYKFVVTGSLGITAREYEVGQLVQLLQTMPQESPAYNAILQGVIEMMNLTNREQILELMEQAQQPDPQQQQMQQAQQQLQMQSAAAQLQKLQYETLEIKSRVDQNAVETQLLPIEEETRRIAAMAKYDKEPDEFERLLKVAELALKEEQNELKARDIDSDERIAALQMQNSSLQRGQQ